VLVVLGPITCHDAGLTLVVDHDGLGGLTEIPYTNHAVTATGSDLAVAVVPHGFVASSSMVLKVLD
jgi:hypothetical protein